MSFCRCVGITMNQRTTLWNTMESAPVFAPKSQFQRSSNLLIALDLISSAMSM